MEGGHVRMNEEKGWDADYRGRFRRGKHVGISNVSLLGGDRGGSVGKRVVNYFIYARLPKP